jgi:hypothetical protein
MKPYTVTDRRRLTSSGDLKQPPRPKGLRAVAHTDILTPLDRAGKYLLEHIKRGIEDGSLTPPLLWTLLLGLLVSARDTYAGAIVLISRKRMIRTLPAQSQTLVRSMFEGYANLIALLQAPTDRARLYARDEYRRTVIQQRWLLRKYGKDPRWRDYLAMRDRQLAAFAVYLTLPSRVARNPTKYIRREWPTPGGLLFGGRKGGRTFKPLLRGNRWRAVKELYDLWYGVLSGLAHQRLVGIGTSMLMYLGLTDDEAFDPTIVESNTATLGSLILASVLSELEVAGGFTPRAELRVVWDLLRSIDDEAEAMYRIRYRRLLKMPVDAPKKR